MSQHGWKHLCCSSGLRESTSTFIQQIMSVSRQHIIPEGAKSMWYAQQYQIDFLTPLFSWLFSSISGIKLRTHDYGCQLTKSHTVRLHSAFGLMKLHGSLTLCDVINWVLTMMSFAIVCHVKWCTVIIKRYCFVPRCLFCITDSNPCHTRTLYRTSCSV